MGIDWRVFTALIMLSVSFAIGISLMIYYAHDTATDQMQDDILALKTKMECPNNECDRFKGKDAKALEARLMAEIDKVRQECK
jgi:uncharacterized membrane protein affecting hemolysin expression